MARNIVVCIDGTGQGFGSSNYHSNVEKLFNIIEDRTSRQITFYDKGVGTHLLDLSGKVTGTGMSAKICRAYQFIYDRYEAGDSIYLFGFSRGAASVSLLADFIHQFGILPSGHRELIPQAYRIFDIKDQSNRNRHANNFIQAHHTMWARVKFLGVWDTVVARGIPIQYLDELLPVSAMRYYRPRLPESVETCYQALAIDEERKPFFPRIWESKCQPFQTLKQVWFCGMHSDVGGGYCESGLSDIALQWMINNAVTHGLLVTESHNLELNPDVNGVMHDSRSGLSAFIYRCQPRYWDVNRYGKPTVHASVLERTLNRHNNTKTPYVPWILEDDYEIEPW